MNELQGISAIDFWSIYDEQFAITDLQEVIERREEESDMVIESIRETIKKAFEHDKNTKKTRIVVDEEAIAEAEAQGYEIEINKAGEMFAQMRGKDGRFGRKLPIKEELAENGITVEEVELAIQMKAIQNLLRSVLDTLEEIDSRVTEVIKGQENDRLGLFFSGLSIYNEARMIQDKSLKRQLISQAIKAFSDSGAQMIQQIRSDMEYLSTKQYRGTKAIEKIDEKMTSIQRCCHVVRQIMYMKMAIYCECHENGAMIASIDEYKRFLECMITPYAGMLTELDKNSHLIESGKWGQMAKSLEICVNMKQLIMKKQAYILPFEGRENDGERLQEERVS